MAVNTTRIAERIALIAAKPAVEFAQETRPARNGRLEERRPVYRFARLILADRFELNCVIIDMSDSGARVRFDGASDGLPEYLLLKLEASGVTKRARVVWQRDHSAGLSFRLERVNGFVRPDRRG